METTLRKSRRRTRQRPEQLRIPARLTFKEGYDAVLENSQIRKIAHGEVEPTGWGAAIAADIAAAHKFLDNFIEDMNKICESKNRYLQRTSAIHINVDWKTQTDPVERAIFIWNQFQCRFAEVTRQILDTIKPRTVDPKKQKPDFCMPLSWIKPSGNYLNFLWADTPTRCCQRELVDWSYKSPDDFTRSVPKDITETLALLKTTHFDYKPTILDGTLVSEYEIQMTTFPQDPGLVLRLGWEDRNLMCRYWKEPFDKEMEDTTWGLHGVYTAGVVLLLLTLVFGIFGYNIAFRCQDALVCFLGWACMVIGALCGLGTIVAAVDAKDTSSRTLNV